MSITFQTTSRLPDRVVGDVLIIPLTVGADMPKDFPSSFQKQVVARMKELHFTAGWGQAELFLAPPGIKASFVAVVGMGEPTLPMHKQLEGLRRGMGRVMSAARRHASRSLVVMIEPATEPLSAVHAIVEVVYLANYRFTHYTKRLSREVSTRSLREVIFIMPRRLHDEVQKMVVKTKRVMAAVELTRTLVNQPASHMSPTTLVEEAKRIAASSPAIQVKIMNRQQARRANFHGFLAVAQGSSEEPYVIHLTYKPKKRSRRRIALIGKGITFDSGGLSLKPADAMMDMKIDMAGAATVLGVFSALPALGLPVEVHGIIAACENMPSGNAYRPGDIIATRDGKTIEVLNTDAEGRITLADALSYAAECKPDAMIDIATLTGACMIAVGETHAGLWSNNEGLQQDIMTAAEHVGEGMVAFPLPDEYKSLIQSKVADLRNIGTTRYGDAILAALFLQEFVGRIPWAHLDVAGPVYSNTSLLPYHAHGATGYGVRTMIYYLQHQATIGE